MATMLEKCTTEKQRSVVRFLWAKGLNAKDILIKMFPVCGGKCLSPKTAHNWVQNFSQGRSKIAEMPDQVRKWLRQQSKDFYVTGFDAMGQAYQCWWRICRETNVFFFQFRISHVLQFISICDRSTDSPSYLLG
jgi:hypothetical protein